MLAKTIFLGLLARSMERGSSGDSSYPGMSELLCLIPRGGFSCDPSVAEMLTEGDSSASLSDFQGCQPFTSTKTALVSCVSPRQNL